jgi:hypothetical protein
MSSSGFAARAQSAGDKNYNASKSNDSKGSANEESASAKSQLGGK